MKNNKKIRVGIFQWCVTDYRLGIFRALQRNADMEFVICASDEPPKSSFLKVIRKNKEFPFINITSWHLKIPILNKIMTFQPYAVGGVISGRFDVIIMADDFSDIGVWINLFLCRLLGRKICLWSQGIIRRCPKISCFIRGFIMRLAHAVIFYTENVRDEWVKRGFPKNKLFVAYNALDTDASDAIKARTTADVLRLFRSQHGLEGKKVVIFCGRLFISWKRPDILIRAMKKVTAKVPDAFAVIIGDGPDRKALEDVISELQLSHAVTLVGAVHDENLIAKYMLCSKIAVIPGNAGLGIQHAFGYGVPVITHNDMNKQTPEIELLIDGVTGRLCRNGDVSDFAQAIISLLTEETDAKK